MEETMMFVANLKGVIENRTRGNLASGVVPEEHENEMGNLSPANTDDLEPGVSVRSIELEFGGKLVRSRQFPYMVRLKNVVLTWAKSKT